MLGKDCRQEEKGASEDEMVGRHHRLNGQQSEQAPGDGDGPGKPGMLQTMGSQRVRPISATAQQHTLSESSRPRKSQAGGYFALKCFFQKLSNP